MAKIQTLPHTRTHTHTQVLEHKENHVPDFVCLCGRIYKDKFVESGHQDTVSRDKAIHWWVGRCRECRCVCVCVCVRGGRIGGVWITSYPDPTPTPRVSLHSKQDSYAGIFTTAGIERVLSVSRTSMLASTWPHCSLSQDRPLPLAKS